MSVYNKQIGGTHYKKMKIQPSEFIKKNKSSVGAECLMKYPIELNKIQKYINR